ncbi:hypothetical protein ABZ697_30940, partial [Streptomyces albidoflavus]|uniref:hypothetical protein n=1 Tax=Streptomyces albidoflavus TaxID=1886 RepID=UPI0033CBFA92
HRFVPLEGYVKDGIITWETQETDYPSVGPAGPKPARRAGCGVRMNSRSEFQGPGNSLAKR